MEFAIACIPSLVLGFLLWRADKRYDEAVASHLAEHHDWAVERRELLTRIQVPERAKVMDMPEPTDEQLYVDFDDDEAINTYREEKFAGRVH